MRTYEEYKNIVNEHLLDYIPQIDVKASTLYESMKYSLTAGGKRLRPVLTLAACEFGNGDIYEALPYACALEYIHTYSLIHDDLPAMDDDDMRRGNPSNHKVYGESIAILAGDGLLNTAAEIMLRDMTCVFDDSKKLKNHVKAALAIMKRAGVSGMIAGQIGDIENEHAECSSEVVDFIEENKTGKLLTAPLVAGLSIAGAADNVVDDFISYAESIGKGFQISDDILDMTGSKAMLGKTAGKDVSSGKCNYAAMNGIDAAKAKLHELTEEAKNAVSKYGEKAEFFLELADKLEGRQA